MIDKEWGEALNGILEVHLKEPLAIRFVMDIIGSCYLIDNITDKDTKITLADMTRLAHIGWIDLISNDFLVRFRPQLVGAMVMALDSWHQATEIEQQVHQDRLPLDALHTSFELKNTIFGIAPLCVELLHGRDAREAFSGEWLKFTRSYETFECYVKKIRAKKRPNKRR